MSPVRQCLARDVARRCETAGLDGCSHGKTMEIQKGKLILSITNGQGQVNLIARAELKLETTGSVQGLVVSAPELHA
jgi:hypothetical protein